MIVLTILNVVLAIAVLAVGALAFTGKLPGNGVVGLRIPEVRKSQENWVFAHKIAGPAWLASGAVLVASSLLTLRISGWMWLVYAMLLVGALFLMGMGSALAASAMARLEHNRSQAEEAERSAAGCCSSGGGDAQGVQGVQGDATGATGEPTAEECASGNACGSCSLNGACEGGAEQFDAAQVDAAQAAGGAGAAKSAEAAKPALDLDAARRAVAEQDRR